jgi:hypothetical protein
MLARRLGMAILAMAFCALGFQAVGAQDTKKTFEVPKDAIDGTVKSVDVKAGSFTLIVKGSKDKTFGVTKETEFWGPRGGDRGTGIKGLNDDCMGVGYEIKVALAKDGKNAKDVYLGYRKKSEPKK